MIPEPISELPRALALRHALAVRRAELRRAEPRLRARDLAGRLGISEAELVALDAGATATPLAPAWPEIVAGLAGLGPVMALTRNDHAVHEKIGCYAPVSVSEGTGLVLGEAIDLRIFFAAWRYGFALHDPAAPDARRSLQFFDRNGTAVHKVYATAATDLAAWERLVARHAAAPAPVIPAPRRERRPAGDAGGDAATLRAAWDALRDTHAFHGMLTRLGLERVAALRLAGEARARRVAPAALRDSLQAAAAAALPIMVFVGSPGVIQIHTGPVARLLATGPWFNVLDEDFNLHLREDAIAEAWVVRKPTDDGVVSSLELFDAAGGTIAMLFGRRKPGQPEDSQWRALLAERRTVEAP
jgi:putative hemin transport protein